MMGREVYILEYVDWRQGAMVYDKEIYGVFETRALARIALQSARTTMMNSIDFRIEQVVRDCEDMFMTRFMRNGVETRRATLVITSKQLNKLF